MEPINLRSPVFRLIYVLLIILTAILISGVLVYVQLSEKEDNMYARAHNYHQSAISILLEISDEISETRLRLFADKSGSPNISRKSYSASTKRDALVLMQRKLSVLVGRIREQQDTYRESEFDILVKRLVDLEQRVTDKVNALVEYADFPDFSYKAMVHGIHVTSHQLQALHQVYYSQLEYEIEQYQIRRTVIISVTSLVLFFLSLSIFLYIMYMIRSVIAAHDDTFAQLCDSEKRYRMLSILSPVGIFRTDRQGHCSYVNERWCEIAGMSKDQALGQGWIEALHPQDREQLCTAWYQTVANKTSFRMEYRFKTCDGKTTWLLGQAEVECDSAGEVTGCVGTITDITEQHYIEQQLRQSQENFIALAQNINEGIVIYQGDTIAYANRFASEMLGYRHGSIVGMSIFEAAHPDYRKQLESAYRDRMTGRTLTSNYESVLMTKKGQPIDVEITASATKWEGQPASLAAISIITERKRIESALKAEHDISQAILDSAGALIVVTDTEGKIELFNQMSEQTTDYNTEEARGRYIWDLLFDGGERDAITEIYDEIARGEAKDQYHSWITTKSRQRKLIEWSSAVINDSAGRAFKIIGIGVDITERQIMQDRLANSEADLVRAQAIANIGSWAWDISHDRLKWSNQAYRIYGIENKQLTITYDVFAQCVHPDDWKEVEEAILASMVNPSRAYDINHRVVLPDGEIRYVRERGKIIRDAEGKAIQFVGTVQDRTEQQLANQVLYTQAAIIDQIHDSVVAVDLEGMVRSWNRGAELLFKHTAAQVIGEPVAFIFPRGVYEKLENQLMGEVEEKGAHDFEAVLLKKNGASFHAHLSLSMQKDSSGEEIGIIAYILDISDRVHASEKLIKSLDEKEVLLRELHHRVKNILQIISSLISMQARKIRSKPARAAFMETRDRIRAVALIYEKLFGESNLSEINVKQYIEYIAGRLDSVYEASSSGITTEVTGDTIILSMEQALPCGLIVNELLTNSYKHAFPNNGSGHVRIELSIDAAGYSIIVSDDGVGIDESKKTTDSFGMQIMATLAGQIDAKLELSRDVSAGHGTLAKLIYAA